MTARHCCQLPANVCREESPFASDETLPLLGFQGAVAGNADPEFSGDIHADGLIVAASKNFPEFHLVARLPSAVTELWGKASAKRPRDEG